MIRKEALVKVKDLSSIQVNDFVFLVSDRVINGERRYLRCKVEQVLNEVNKLKVRPQAFDKAQKGTYANHVLYVTAGEILVPLDRLEKRMLDWRNPIGDTEQTAGVGARTTDLFI